MDEHAACRLLPSAAGITHLALGCIDRECWQCWCASALLWHAAWAKMDSHGVYVCLSLGSSNGNWRQLMTVQFWDWTSARITRDAEKDPGSGGRGGSYRSWASGQFCILSHVYVARRVHGVRHWVSPATVRGHPCALLTVLGGSLTALPCDSSSAGAGRLHHVRVAAVRPGGFRQLQLGSVHGGASTMCAGCCTAASVCSLCALRAGQYGVAAWLGWCVHVLRIRTRLVGFYWSHAASWQGVC
jgi:hypothetical protein